MREMKENTRVVILHIGAVKQNNPYSGVAVVLPEHVKNQQNHEKVAFLNLFDYKIESIQNVYLYSAKNSICNLEPPFNNPDLIVFHEVYRTKYIKIVREVIRLKVPYVIIPHGCLTKNAQHIKPIKKKIANEFFFKRFINNTTAIQYLSADEQKTSIFRDINSFVSTNGIYLPSTSKVNFRSTNIKFVYIGRIDIYHKGLDLLIEAIGKCGHEFKSQCCELHIYGPAKGKQGKLLEELIGKCPLKACIYLHGPVTGKDKEKVLLDADYFIQTSRFEGMPMGILEAMSYGLPVCITDGTTLNCLVDKYNAGYTCVCDTDSINHMILTAIKNVNCCNSKSHNAKLLVQREFDWNAISEKVLKYYSKLVR